MTPFVVGLLVLAGMLALMVLRFPIAAAMFIPGFIGYASIAGLGQASTILKGLAQARLTTYDLCVIPLFILMGQFATEGRLSHALYDFARAMVGHVKGGLAVASVLSCAAFGAICGSSLATVATVTQVALPEMRRHGYSLSLSGAVLAAGGTLGILIPPSVILVIYAIVAEQNIAKLFAAAFLPGIIAAVGYVLVVFVYLRIWPDEARAGQWAGWGEIGRLAMQVWPVVFVFAVVFVGIYGGFFTPTEGAAVGVVLTFAIALAKGGLGFAALGRSFLGTAETTGMIFMILIGADMMNSALALSRMPAALAGLVLGSGIDPILIITLIVVFYVVLGCVMDELSMVVLTVPIFFPVIMGLDLHGLGDSEKAIWFGILILMVVEIGLICPPVGLNLYVVESLSKEMTIGHLYRGIWLFVVSDLVRTGLLIAFPALSLWLVRLFY